MKPSLSYYLLVACSKFAVTHKVIFNVINSQRLIVQFRLRLCGDALPYTESYKYLGHIDNSNLTDDADIVK